MSLQCLQCAPGKRVILTLFNAGIGKRSNVIFARQKKQCHFLHWNVHFYTARKSLFCSAKFALLLLLSAVSWSSVFHWNCENEAVQNRMDVLDTVKNCMLGTTFKNKHTPGKETVNFYTLGKISRNIKNQSHTEYNGPKIPKKPMHTGNKYKHSPNICHHMFLLRSLFTCPRTSDSGSRVRGHLAVIPVTQSVRTTT